MLPLPSAFDPGTAILLVLVAAAGIALFDVARGVGRALKERLYRALRGREWEE